MASKNSSVILRIASDPALQIVLTTTSSLALCGCVVAVVTKLTFLKVFPQAWKCCLLCQDVACLLLSLGLLLIACHVGGASDVVCRAGGFFTVFGILDFVSSITLTGITFMLIQNPTKMSQLSTFRWQIYLSFMIPPKVLATVLAAFPVSSLDYFDTTSPYSLACFPVRQEGRKGAAFGAIVIFIIWGLMALALVVSVVLAARFWAGPGPRVHASTPSIWQMQKIEQSKSLHKFSMLELTLTVVTMLIVTIVGYTNNNYLATPQWIALLSLAVVGLVHVGLAVVQLFMWSGLCCDRTGQKKEPHHRLKQLELIRTEGPGKLRLKVTWAVGKGVWKRGLLKVYGPAHIKAWAQEIVVLGLLRKSRSASVLQCLWTSNINPYYEAMTLVSGDIVTSDARLTCLELTSSGTLQELLKTMEVPLPESCQRTIMRDIAEGLSCLHDQNVLHRNLTSAAVYLKGSVQRLVIRAAIGDFEEAQIYGTLLTGSPNSTISKKRFFYPDIRSYALVGIEMLVCLCELKRRDMLLHGGTALNVSSNLDDTSASSGKGNTHADKNKHLLPYDECSNENVTESIIFGVKRFDNPETPYCAPGEPEYSVNSMEKMKTDEHVDQSNPTHKSYEHPERKTTNVKNYSCSINSTGLDNDEGNDQLPEYNIDNNWKLQPRTVSVNLNEDRKVKAWSETDEASEWEEYKGISNASHVKKASNFSFPNYSIFRALDAGCAPEELDIIEENIDQYQNMKVSAKNGHYQHAGYVTSVTDDGREIFIPATYKMKKSGGNSSSGYGSSSGSTIVQMDKYSSAGTVNSSAYATIVSDTKRFHKTTSFGKTGSVEDDILEVLPAVGESDYKSRRMFEELLKSEEEERVDQLIASYEERVRKGEPPEDLHHLLAGIVFPRKNSKQDHDIGLGLDTLALQRSPHHEDQTVNGSNKRQNETLSLQRQKTDLTHCLQQDEHGSKNASNSSFQEWNARSSLNRNKARLSLRKALRKKNLQSTQLTKRKESRGMKGHEVEQKYSSRHGTLTTSFPPQKGGTPNKILKENPTFTTGNSNNDLSFQTRSSTANSLLPEIEIKDDECTKGKSNGVDHVLVPHAIRKPSSKNHPAPRPPAAPIANANFTSRPGEGKVSTFSGYTKDTQCTSEYGNMSFSSVDQTSSESNYTNQSSVHFHEQMSIDKIESDMNDIIQQSNPSLVQSKAVMPLGIRIIDSGFDSDSVSSQDSCVCAAAALQLPEEGSTSYPSEVFSQGRCSCACSSCLGSIQGLIKESSWPDSPDSESWDNSNSFSSYENNMHRRKLNSKRDKEDSTGCVLAPDDQYPSSVHRGKTRSVGFLNPQTNDSIDNNQRRLSHSIEHYSSSASETSSSASRCYRELIKRGVPLRVSVISGKNSPTNNIQEEVLPKADVNHTSDVAAIDNQEKNVYKKLKRKDVINKLQYPLPHKNIVIESVALGETSEDEHDRYIELSPIPSLEEIIKEIPDETGCYSEETKAFLNRPDSELSIKALQEVLSRHDSASDREHVQHSGQVTDTILWQHGLPNNRVFNFYQDKSTAKETVLPSTNRTSVSVPVSVCGLLTGMDGKHVKYCQTISDNVTLINLHELLPANLQSFDKLRLKLQQNGNTGLIGKQILELIRMCWLNEAPPTTADIVDQLTDHVMETEL